jgi:hypothetical protein
MSDSETRNTSSSVTASALDSLSMSSSSSLVSIADLVTGDKKAQRGFECMVCKKILKEPIINCTGGHSFCKQCESGVKCCPLPTLEHRNLALETIIRDLELPVSCQHHKEGCEFSAGLKEVISHESKCRYRMVHCQIPTCYDEIQERYSILSIPGLALY